ncbi:MAG: transporter substrate-binding domain-containing protein [Spirochaetales bacterium]|nr:transporter substrate-binding domain-containing protein [Spirochaetales bacterium]
MKRLLFVFISIFCIGSVFGQLRFVAADNAKPLFWVEDSEYKGLYADVLYEVLNKKLKIPYTIEAFPWERAQQMVEHGEADAMITINTPQRLNYSKANQIPLLTSKISLFIKKGRDDLYFNLLSVKSYKDLKPYQIIGLIGDSKLKDYLIEDEYKIYRVNNHLSILQMLFSERADIWIHSVSGAQTIIKQYGYEDKIINVPITLQIENFHLLISRKSKYLYILTDFDLALKEIKESGLFARILEKYGIPENSL